MEAPHWRTRTGPGERERELSGSGHIADKGARASFSSAFVRVPILAAFRLWATLVVIIFLA